MEKKSFNGNTAILRILNVSEMGADRRPPAAFYFTEPAVLLVYIYYSAAYLISGSEVPGLSTRSAAKCAIIRVFVFYMIIFETNSSRFHH